MGIITRGRSGEKTKIAKKGRGFLLLPLLLLTAALLLFPGRTVEAARAALVLWARAVVPALLPFFIVSELLTALGAARLAGRILSPLMRPLFALPGEAALAVVMGLCCGFPTGAAVTAALRRQGDISPEEGARLLAFTNNAGPLYLTATAASAVLGCPAAAPLLAAGHYGINLLLGMGLGLLARLRGKGGPGYRWDRDKERPRSTQQDDAPRPAPPESAPPALLMKTAAQRAAANLLLIGCYMAFFAAAAALLPEGLPPLAHAAGAGLLEMTLGLNAVAESGLSLTALLPLAGAELAFGGLSVQMQVLAMAADTDISPRLYLLSRPLHSLLAAGFTRWALLRFGLPLAAGGTAAVPIFTAGGILSRSLAQAGLLTAGWLLAAGLSRKGRS
ncbi:MAG: hypothetical protein IKD93_05205 [Firmicutes bacterium]|nr:hypothetical protein [Bacillota bacterium]